MLDPETIKLAIIVINFLLGLAVGVYTFIKTRRKDVDEKIQELAKDVDVRLKEGSKRMDRHDQRMTAAEQTIKSMPEKDDIHSIELQMVDMVGSLKEIRAIMDGNAKIMECVETIVSRHEDHLLEGGK